MRNPASNLVVESCFGWSRTDDLGHMMKDDPSGLRRAILMKGKAPYRVVILKRRFPASSRKSIVRNTVKCVVLTIIDFHVLEDDSQSVF